MCRMTEISGACDSSDFIGNTDLVGIVNEYIFISGLEYIKFTTEDKLIDFISLMGTNLIPSAIAIEKYTHSSYLNNKISLKATKPRKGL